MSVRAQEPPLDAPTDWHAEGGSDLGGLSHRWLLAIALAGLALGIGTASVLGPLVLGAMEYRTSATMENQFLGSDAAALFVLAPLALAVAVLAATGRRIAAPLAAGIGVYALYTYSQNVIGQEYLRLPGNADRFFPLFLAIFVLAEAVVALTLGQLSGLPRVSRRLERATSWVLVALAAFMVFVLHLPSMLTAWTDPESLTEYASAPTPFWMVKLMDLGIIVPVAVATAVGLRRGAPWARRTLYPLLTGYACLAVSVTSMSVVMLVRDDPDASLVVTVGFAGFAVALWGLLSALYWPLLRSGEGRSLERSAHVHPHAPAG